MKHFRLLLLQSGLLPCAVFLPILFLDCCRLLCHHRNGRKAVSYELWAVGCELWAVSCGLWVVGCER